MVHYASARYIQAAENFSKALVANPQCDSSLRTSLALCYYKLLQFDKAYLSSQRAISMEVFLNFGVQIFITYFIMKKFHSIEYGCHFPGTDRVN